MPLESPGKKNKSQVCETADNLGEKNTLATTRVVFFINIKMPGRTHKNEACSKLVQTPV
jgi:hypothetical protein